jgi:hypothetical protein
MDEMSIYQFVEQMKSTVMMSLLEKKDSLIKQAIEGCIFSTENLSAEEIDSKCRTMISLFICHVIKINPATLGILFKEEK